MALVLSSAEASIQHEDEVRQELLKSTYRLDAAAHAEAYAAVDRAKAAPELAAAVTLYKVQGGGDLNASVLPLAARRTSCSRARRTRS